MLDLPWLDHLPEGTLESTTVLANRLYWNLTVAFGDGFWYVNSGEIVVFKTDSIESLDAFLYGLGLAYSIFPEPVFEVIQTELGRWVE